MSAVNVVRADKAIHLFTDGASYEADGTLRAISSKVVPLPHLRAALAARGPSLFLPIFAQHMAATIATFDGLVETAPELAREVSEDYAGIFDACLLGIGFDLVLAGWSERRDRAVSYLVSTKPVDGRAPYSLVPLNPLFISPYDADLEARCQVLSQRLGAQRDDPVVAGLAIMEEQRGVKAVQGGCSVPSAGVGGFCQLTTITREGIETRILKRWPDRIGERLGQGPTPIQAGTVPMAEPAIAAAGPSRQQRRAAERQRR